jgi:hypothetical protein
MALSACATLFVTMFRHSAHRIGITFLVMVSLLFSQLALANYICSTVSGQEQMVMEMASGEPCEGMEAEASQPALCHQHCTNAPQSFEAVKLPTVSLPAVVQILLVPVSIDVAAQEADTFAEAGLGQPPPEPVFLSTLRLRV